MILTINERELASYLKDQGLTYKEIAYLKWRNFSFDGRTLSVPRRIWCISYHKKINLEKDSRIWHIVQTFDEKRRWQNRYFMFYKQAPIKCCRRDDERRYGSPFTPEEIESMIMGYSEVSDPRSIKSLELARI